MRLPDKRSTGTSLSGSTAKQDLVAPTTSFPTDLCAPGQTLELIRAGFHIYK
jgi:hypothetical protein